MSIGQVADLDLRLWTEMPLQNTGQTHAVAIPVVLPRIGSEPSVAWRIAHDQGQIDAMDLYERGRYVWHAENGIRSIAQP